MVDELTNGAICDSAVLLVHIIVQGGAAVEIRYVVLQSHMAIQLVRFRGGPLRKGQQHPVPEKVLRDGFKLRFRTEMPPEVARRDSKTLPEPEPSFKVQFRAPADPSRS